MESRFVVQSLAITTDPMVSHTGYLKLDHPGDYTFGPYWLNAKFFESQETLKVPMERAIGHIKETLATSKEEVFLKFTKFVFFVVELHGSSLADVKSTIHSTTRVTIKRPEKGCAVVESITIGHKVNKDD